MLLNKLNNISRNIFQPSTFIMKRLNTTYRFLIISVLHLVPLATLDYFFQDNLNGQITFTQKELYGTEYISPVWKTMVGVTNSMTNSSEKNAKTIEESITRLKDKEAKFRSVLETSDSVKKIIYCWEQKPLVKDEQVGRELYDCLNSESHRLITTVGDSSNLILDPELASYYLMETLVVKMTDLIPDLVQINDLAKKIQENKGIISPDIQGQIKFLASRLNSFNERLQHNKGTSLNNDPIGTLKPTLNTYFTNLSQKISDLVEEMDDISVGKVKAINAGDFVAKTQQIVVASDILWSNGVKELDDLLNYRLANLNRIMSIVVVITVLIIFITIFLFVGILYAEQEKTKISQEIKELMRFKQ